MGPKGSLAGAFCMKKLFQITWVFSLITPFFLLDLKWAVIVLLINFIGILPLGFLIVGVLKPLIGAGHWLLSYLSGVGEITFYLLLNRFLNHPKNFLLALVMVYLINQSGRIFRPRFQADEAITLMGFLSILSLGYLFRLI